MNCFNHTDKVAIGICKSCNKGLCVDCASSTGTGLACSGVHEANVIEVDKYVAWNMARSKNLSPTSAHRLAVMSFAFLLGVAIVYEVLAPSGTRIFSLLGGLILGLGAGSILIDTAKVALFGRKNQPPP